MADVPLIPVDCMDLKNPLRSYIFNIVAIALSCALWGAGCMQTFLYYLNYESDHFLLKTMVAFLWSLDTVVEVLNFVGTFPAMASPLPITTAAYVPRVLYVRVLLTNVVAFTVQLFFLYRIYRLSGRRRTTLVCLAIVASISFYQVAGALLFTAYALAKSLSVVEVYHVPLTNALQVSCRAVGAFTDVVIAVWMAVILQKKRRSLFRGTDRLIFRLTLLTISTGLWTAVLAIVDFSLIASQPLALVFTLFEYPLSALYVNTFLANLNARNYMRSGARSDGPVSLGIRASDDVPLTRVGQKGHFIRQQGSLSDRIVAVQMDKSVIISSDTGSTIDAGTSKA
ncbi:hypothetical protein PsYK624_000540 [Phanerochaete sordida]|uniref:DUF6534 domain-containing protein n=1 Tax=Phanerochaete sordida TaxID=48140 RepID=A0A9P3L6L1_9APHY|nr:hypothetical protein PsYK624_000540 [Phanerochaete sordida]